MKASQNKYETIFSLTNPKAHVGATVPLYVTVYPIGEYHYNWTVNNKRYDSHESTIAVVGTCEETQNISVEICDKTTGDVLCGTKTTVEFKEIIDISINADTNTLTLDGADEPCTLTVILEPVVDFPNANAVSWSSDYPPCAVVVPHEANALVADVYGLQPLDAVLVTAGINGIEASVPIAVIDPVMMSAAACIPIQRITIRAGEKRTIDGHRVVQLSGRNFVKFISTSNLVGGVHPGSSTFQVLNEQGREIRRVIVTVAAGCQPTPALPSGRRRVNIRQDWRANSAGVFQNYILPYRYTKHNFTVHSQRVEFLFANGSVQKFWRTVGADLLYDSHPESTSFYVPRARENNFDPETGAIRIYTKDELKFLYGIDPHGVAVYIRDFAVEMRRAGHSLKQTVEYKDEMFEFFFDRVPRYFTRERATNGTLVTRSHSKAHAVANFSDINTRLSESETLFGNRRIRQPGTSVLAGLWDLLGNALHFLARQTPKVILATVNPTIGIKVAIAFAVPLLQTAKEGPDLGVTLNNDFHPILFEAMVAELSVKTVIEWAGMLSELIWTASLPGMGSDIFRNIPFIGNTNNQDRSHLLYTKAVYDHYGDHPMFNVSVQTKARNSTPPSNAPLTQLKELANEYTKKLEGKS